MADQPVTQSIADNIMFIGFADNKIPEFKEVRSKDWILYGEDNMFPEHILYLYNKSSNHNAIIDGKTTYICGKGFPVNNPVNDAGETINKVMRKICKDIELFGGFRLELIWNLLGTTATVRHIPFQKLRISKKKDGYFYRKNWKGPTREDEAVFIPNFDKNKRKAACIFAYDEYRPGCDLYPLPGFFGALNDIETDAEISKYNLSVMKNGMFSSKMITFNTGDPGEEGKRKIEKGVKDKFTGSGNAGKFWLVFNTDPAKAPIIDDLSTTDLDKLFDQLKKTTQSAIFTGHQVTSPMLFGVKTEGQLGGRTEIMDAYEIFKNTYINDKQQNIEEVFDFLAPYIGLPVGQKIIPVEPLSVAINPVDFKDILPREWILEKLNIDPEEYPDEATTLPASPAINEHLKGLTGRQTQNLHRVIRQFKKGQITRAMAEILLSKGYNLQPDDINTFLSFYATERETEVAEMFAAVGESKEGYVIVKSKPYKFGYDEFADISQLDSNILNLIGKDKRITPDVIATTLKEKPEYIRARIDSLQERGVLTASPVASGVDTITEYAVNKEVIDTRPPATTVDVYVRYSYEPKPGLEPIIETTRPFCKRLIELDKLYTRAEIESISQRVGFSVWDRKGGFWDDKDECRHRWVSNVIVKKRS